MFDMSNLMTYSTCINGLALVSSSYFQVKLLAIHFPAYRKAYMCESSSQYI
jgi:hypothetical protein